VLIKTQQSILDLLLDAFKVLVVVDSDVEVDAQVVYEYLVLVFRRELAVKPDQLGHFVARLVFAQLQSVVVRSCWILSANADLGPDLLSFLPDQQSVLARVDQRYLARSLQFLVAQQHVRLLQNNLEPIETAFENAVMQRRPSSTASGIEVAWEVADCVQLLLLDRHK
jgi:hypothetical protein